MNTVIILDFDHTLIHSVKKKATDDTIKKSKCFIESKNYNVFLRPHINTFLDECFALTPYVILWSAGTGEYIKNTTEYLSKDYAFYRIITRSTYDTSKKNVDLIMTDSVIKKSNIYFVDDIPSRISCSHDINILEIKPFNYTDEKDNCLKLTLDIIKALINK